MIRTGRPMSGRGLVSLPTRLRPGTDSDRIDVRRGDLPYERVVYDPALASPLTDTTVTSVADPAKASA